MLSVPLYVKLFRYCCAKNYQTGVSQFVNNNQFISVSFVLIFVTRMFDESDRMFVLDALKWTCPGIRKVLVVLRINSDL